MDQWSEIFITRSIGSSMIYPKGLDVGKRSLSSRTMPLRQYANYDYDMKRTRLEMIEEPEAFQRFRDAPRRF